jgi:cytochrome c oxidase assembly protein subunit 15
MPSTFERDVAVPELSVAGTPARADWRTAVPADRRRHLRVWLGSIAALTFGVLIVGGITRLTHSGLSMVEWDPLFGIIPPLNDAQWHEVFDRYRQFPEYRLLRQGMSLEEFRFIFFWEYIHRVLARLIGFVFLLPFIYFAARRYFSRPLALRALALFGLGAMQGVMGWLMVASGLVDRPSVSHFRLAAHLTLAFMIFGYAVWLIRELSFGEDRPPVSRRARRLLGIGVLVVGVLLGLQIVWGAFVAGLRAGFIYNTFPLMGGRLVPATLRALDNPLIALLEHPAAVQWLHRVLGTLLLLAAAGAYLYLKRQGVDRQSLRIVAALSMLVAVQYAFGILTLLLVVPVPLAVVHQATAMVIFGVWVAWAHHAHNLRVPEAAAVRARE